MSGLRLLHPCPALSPAPSGVLGGAVLPGMPGRAPWPEQCLHLQALGEPWREAWATEARPEAGRDGDVRWCGTGQALFALVEFDEATTRPPGRGAGEHLRELARSAYGQLFGLLQQRGLPHLWRVWIYLPAINAEVDGLERYRWFNLGRHAAYAERGADLARQAPAASALGSAAGPLSIACLAGRTPSRPIENPRQLSAWQYPAQYGPRPPVFARAALVGSGAHECLLVSGTASIVGHASLHAGDVIAQCEETVRNLQAVFTAASDASGSRRYDAAQALHRVYLRHAGDADRVRLRLGQLLPGAGLQLLQADICRKDLLVEIESVAPIPAPAP